MNSTPGVSAEEISRRAYDLWEQEGRPESRELEHWLRAEQELRARQQSTLTPSLATTAADDTQPLQGTRAAAAAARDAKPETKTDAPKRNGGTPVATAKVGARAGSSARAK